MISLVLCLLAICCVLALVVKCTRVLRYPGRDPPQYPGAWPLIGHTHLLLFLDKISLWNNLKDVYYHCVEKGGVITGQIGFITVNVIADPEDCVTIADTCLKKHYIYDFAKDWLGSGLTTVSDVPTWKRHRKLLNPAFSHHVLNGFLNVFNSQARKLERILRDHVGKGLFIPESYLIRNVTETTCLTTLHLNTDDYNKVGKEYVLATQKIFDGILTRFQKFWMHSNFIYRLSPLKREQDKLITSSTKILTEVMRTRKLELLNKKANDTNDADVKPGKFKPLLDLILELAMEDGAFTDLEVREHLDTVVIANYDTSRTTMTYILLLIGSHKEVQDRMYNEIQEVFGDSERDVDKYDLINLVYVEAVIKETLRIYPVVPVVGRYTETEVKLKNYTLPAGSTCVLSIYGLHRHSSWGPDADLFRPERWLDRTSLPDNPNAFAGFSLGKRNCIGKRYAMMMMKTTLVHLLRRYQISSDVSKLVQKMDVMLRPESGHEIALELRM